MDMNQYLDMFIEESKENLQTINHSLLDLEKTPEDLTLVQEIFRAAHTLKGMAGSMGFENLSSLTHEMENVLDKIRNEEIELTSEILDVIFSCVDLLEEMIYSIAEGEKDNTNVSTIVRKLEEISKGNVKAVSNKKEEVSFDEFQKNVIEKALMKNWNVYKITVSVEKECKLKAARAYMVITNLESIGEIIHINPSVEDIEEDNFNESFDLVFITDKNKSSIKNSIISVSEIENVLIEDVQLEEQKEDIKNESEEDRNSKERKTDKKVNNTKTIRVGIDKLDELMNLFSQLVIDKGRLEEISRNKFDPELTETVEHLSRISNDLQDLILNVRMVPIDQVFNRFPRMIRDLTKELKKKVNLSIDGGETELDRIVIDEIGDPLVHLIRNSLDHGIENPEDRVKNGKSEEGELSLQAYYSGNNVYIQIKDDGNGINKEKVLNKAIKNGVLSESKSKEMSDREVFDLLFTSGLSTADTISDISGRGVGLDVVKTKIESLGGSIIVESTEGIGTTFTIQLPLTLSIMDAMLLKVGKEKYALPLSSIVEVMSINKEDIQTVGSNEVMDYRGKIIPLVYLQNILETSSMTDYSQENEVHVVVTKKADSLAGFVVDSILGQQEIVLKSLGDYVGKTFGVSGATVLGDGQVALIIDSNDLIK